MKLSKDIAIEEEDSTKGEYFDGIAWTSSGGASNYGNRYEQRHQRQYVNPDFFNTFPA